MCLELVICLAPLPAYPIYITKYSEIVRRTACGGKKSKIFMILLLLRKPYEKTIIAII